MLRDCFIIFVIWRCCIALSRVMRRGRILPVSVTKRLSGSVSFQVKSNGVFECFCVSSEFIGAYYSIF